MSSTFTAEEFKKAFRPHLFTWAASWSLLMGSALISILLLLRSQNWQFPSLIHTSTLTIGNVLAIKLFDVSANAVGLFAVGINIRWTFGHGCKRLWTFCCGCKRYRDFAVGANAVGVFAVGIKRRWAFCCGYKRRRTFCHGVLCLRYLRLILQPKRQRPLSVLTNSPRCRGSCVVYPLDARVRGGV